MNRLTAAWSLRTPPERRAIAVLAGIVVASLVVALVWLPLERSRARLAAELPALRASIAALQRDADEVKRLRAMPAPAARPASPLAALATNGGGLSGAQMTVLDERRLRLVGDDVSFGALLEWLRNAQSTHGVRVESAKVEARPAAGRVRADIVVARS